MKIKPWIEAMRLRTLPVSIAGVVAGIGCGVYCAGTWRPVPATICLIFAILAQICSNFANEYYDFRNGMDRPGREGFRRGVTEGDISPRQMKRATFMTLLLACLCGLSLVFYGGWWLIAVGIAIAVFALAYSAGPWPLSHHGMGDIAVIVFFGIVPVCFTAYLQCPNPDILPISIPISVAIGLMADNVLIVNNYRDAEDDASVGKRTLVVILGRRCMSLVYLLFGLTAAAIIFFSLHQRVAEWRLLWIPIYLIGHIFLWTKMQKRRGSLLNPLLGKTAMLLFFSSVMLLLTLI